MLDGIGTDEDGVLEDSRVVDCIRVALIFPDRPDLDHRGLDCDTAGDGDPADLTVQFIDSNNDSFKIGRIVFDSS